MGYVSKDIAAITEPKIISLSALPNFVQFASTPSTKVNFEATVQVNIEDSETDIPTKTLIQITEPSGAVHAFHGTTVVADVGGAVFFVADDKADTAENLRQALTANSWINANFEVRIPSVWVAGAVSNGRVLNIKSKGTGADYIITIVAPNNTAAVAYSIAYVSATSTNDDSISGEASTAQIELDIYEGADIFLGEDDRPLTPAKLGTYTTSLQKTYAGRPLWFDLNALFNQYGGYNRPPEVMGWFDTGTARVFRFIAKVRGVNSYAFYQSNALYVLNGYGYASDEIDLNDYTYNDNEITLLTNKPRTTYVRGQRAFLNFLFKDPLHGATENDFIMRVAYRAYTSAGTYLGVIFNHPIHRTQLNVVNTCALNIDGLLDAYPKTGFVKIALARGTTIISNDIEYTVRPDCLHDLTQFIFLNRLGGWDAFNFDNTPVDEIKPAVETYRKTITPAFQKGESIETVYTSSLANSVTVEGAPVTDEVADWLKELAAARVVFDGAGNYVVKEDFILRVSEASENMQVPTIKYRLSETYTND